VGYHADLQHSTSMCWQSKTQLQSGPVTADLHLLLYIAINRI